MPRPPSPASSRADAIVAAVRRELRGAADPARAARQQAYMKSAMPYLGVTVPASRETARAAARAERDAGCLLTAARTLWDEASHREERYAAMTLLGVGRANGDPDSVALIEHMVRIGRWWDITDELSHRMAALHDAHPVDTAALARRWSVDEDLWMRRLAILSQLGRRLRVDPDLLADVIEPNRSDGEFFIRKAIGWALREYARVAPEWVRGYVTDNELSPLSRREALKHLST